MAEYIANFELNRNTLEFQGELSQNQLHADLIVDYRPSKTSQLINDSGYITIADVPTKLSELVNDTGFITASSLIPLENDIVEIENDILGLQNNKVDKVTGKGLSTNDFTNAFKTKLEGIEAGAEVNKVNSVNGQTGDVAIEIPDSATWGNITGTLSNQTDLQTALNGKQPTISDLDAIRTGAGKGATALQPNDNITQLVNNAGYITGITSSDVTTALGYTPYNSTNPAGYTSNVGTVTSVNNIQPVNGNVTLPSSEYTAGKGIDITYNSISIKQGGNSIYRFDGTRQSTQIYNITWNFNIEDTVEFMFKYNITDYNADYGRAIFEASNSSTSTNRSRLSIYVSNNSTQSSYGQSGIRFRYFDADGDSYSSTITGANFITGDYFNRDLYLKILKRYDVSTSKIGVIISLSTDGINWNDSEEVMSASTTLGSLIFTTLKIGESNYSFNGYANHSYMKGTIDFSPSYIKVNDAYFWQGSIYVSSGVATASTLLYGLVKPDGTSITANDGIISSHIVSSDVITALGYTPYNSTNPNGYATEQYVDDIVGEIETILASI